MILCKWDSGQEEHTIRIHSQRPVHQVQIDIIQPQFLEAEIQRLLHPGVVRTPQLRRHEHILPLDFTGGEGLLESLTNLLFVLVAGGGVDVSVAHGNGVADGLLDLSVGGLPCSCVSTLLALSSGMNGLQFVQHVPSPKAGISAPVLSL